MTSSWFNLGPTLKTFNFSHFGSMNGLDFKTMAIIVKTFEINVGFLFLTNKLRAIWMPVGRMDCIDLRNDFFLIKFELHSDWRW